MLLRSYQFKEPWDGKFLITGHTLQGDSSSLGADGSWTSFRIAVFCSNSLCTSMEVFSFLLHQQPSHILKGEHRYAEKNQHSVIWSRWLNHISTFRGVCIPICKAQKETEKKAGKKQNLWKLSDSLDFKWNFWKSLHHPQEVRIESPSLMAASKSALHWEKDGIAAWYENQFFFRQVENGGEKNPNQKQEEKEKLRILGLWF